VADLEGWFKGFIKANLCLARDNAYPPSVSGPSKWRQFEPEVILLAVGWYLRFPLSYRDAEELLAEQNVHCSSSACSDLPH